MKFIVMSTIFCAIINTATAQATLLPVSSSKQAEVQMVKDKNIVENISANTEYGLFYKSINYCDLTYTFNHPGPLTVFLPPDSAFNNLPPGKMDELLMSQSKFNMIALLTYHALPGVVTQKDIAKHIQRGKGVTRFQTIAGAWLTAQLDESGNIMLIDETGGKSILLKTNITQKNGIIHIVSGVMQPKIKSV